MAEFSQGQPGAATSAVTGPGRLEPLGGTMHYQLMVYRMLDHAQVQLTKAEATPTGYSWAHLILESVPIPPDIDLGDAADAAWWIGQLLEEWALNRRPAGPSTAVAVDQ